MFDLATILEQTPLGDKRLNQRALTLVHSIIQGQASATHGPEGIGRQHTWAHAIGAFRFFDNDRLTLPELYKPCGTALQQLVPPGERCYIIHDVSVVDYSCHQAKNDLIPVGNGSGYGYELFSSLVLDKTGNPVGSLMQEVRTQKGLLSSQSATPLPFVDHMTQVERAIEETQRILPSRISVHVADREFDELQLLRFVMGQRGLYIIRAQHLGRQILWEGQRTTLRHAVAHTELKAAGPIWREGKEYQMYIGEAVVSLDGKSLRGVAKRKLKPKSGVAISVRVVITELRRQGQTPLQWVLLTNETTDPLQVVQAYVWRWRVERFFYLTKVGLNLEQWRQETGERIARRLAVTQLAVMAVYQMQAVAPFDAEMGDLLQTVALMGGWLGRKQDPIGPIVLMRGMQLVLGMVFALNEFGEQRIREVAQKLSDYLGLPTAKPLREKRCV